MTHGESVRDDNAGWREARTLYFREDEEVRIVWEVHPGYRLAVLQVRRTTPGRDVPQEAQEAPEAQEAMQVRTEDR